MKHISFPIILNHDSMVKSHRVQILGWLQQFFQVLGSDSQCLSPPRPNSQNLRVHAEIVLLKVKCKGFWRYFMLGPEWIGISKDVTINKAPIGKKHFKTNMTKTGTSPKSVGCKYKKFRFLEKYEAFSIKVLRNIYNYHFRHVWVKMSLSMCQPQTLPCCSIRSLASSRRNLSWTFTTNITLLRLKSVNMLFSWDCGDSISCFLFKYLNQYFHSRETKSVHCIICVYVTHKSACSNCSKVS